MSCKKLIPVISEEVLPLHFFSSFGIVAEVLVANTNQGIREVHLERDTAVEDPLPPFRSKLVDAFNFTQLLLIKIKVCGGDIIPDTENQKALGSYGQLLGVPYCMLLK